MPNNYFKKYILPVSLVFFFAAIALAVFVFADKHFALEKESKNIGGEIALQKNASDKNDSGKILGEEGMGAPAAKFGSENFRVPQIIIGAEGGIFYPGADEQKEITVSDVKSEIFADKNKKDKKLLLSWTTSKPAKSAVEYFKAGMESGQIYEEDGYSIEHAALLEPLENSTTYDYTISMRDRSGTAVSTEKFAIYTGAPQMSFFDLVAGAFKGVFGWVAK